MKKGISLFRSLLAAALSAALIAEPSVAALPPQSRSALRQNQILADALEQQAITGAIVFAIRSFGRALGSSVKHAGGQLAVRTNPISPTVDVHLKAENLLNGWNVRYASQGDPASLYVANDQIILSGVAETAEGKAFHDWFMSLNRPIGDPETAKRVRETLMPSVQRNLLRHLRTLKRTVGVIVSDNPELIRSKTLFVETMVDGRQLLIFNGAAVREQLELRRQFPNDALVNFGTTATLLERLDHGLDHEFSGPANDQAWEDDEARVLMNQAGRFAPLAYTPDGRLTDYQRRMSEFHSLHPLQALKSGFQYGPDGFLRKIHEKLEGFSVHEFVKTLGGGREVRTNPIEGNVDRWIPAQKIPEFMNSQPAKFGLSVQKMEIHPLVGNSNPAELFQDPRVEFGISATNGAAMTFIQFAGEGIDIETVKKSKVAADADGVDSIHNHYIEFVKSHPGVAIVSLGSEGSRDGSVFIPSMRIYYHGYLEGQSDTEHDYYRDFTYKAGNGNWIEDWNGFHAEVLRLQQQGTHIYGAFEDGLEGTNNLILPNARPASARTNAGAVAALVDLPVGPDGKLIIPRIHDDSRIWAFRGPSGNLTGHLFEPAPETMIRYVLTTARVHFTEDQIPRYAQNPNSLPREALDILNHTVFLALGPRSASVLKAGDKRHLMGIVELKKLAQRFGLSLQVYHPGDGNLFGSFLAFGKVDLGNGYHMVAFDRMGGVEGFLAAIAQRSLRQGEFVGSFVSPTGTNADLWSGQHYAYDTEELSALTSYGWTSDQARNPLNPAQIPEGVVVYGAGTGAPAQVRQPSFVDADGTEVALAYGNVANWMRRIQFLPDSEGLGGTIVTNALVVAPPDVRKGETVGRMFVVRTHYRTADLENSMMLLRNAHAEAQVYWKQEASKLLATPSPNLSSWDIALRHAQVLGGLGTSFGLQRAIDVIQAAAQGLGGTMPELARALRNTYQHRLDRWLLRGRSTPTNIFFFGVQGSDKGTHGKELAQKLMLPYIESSDLLRNDPEAAAAMARGDIVTIELVQNAWRTALDKPENSNGFVADGFPRTIEQWEWIQNYLKQKGQAVTLAVYMKVSLRTGFKRALLRGQATARHGDNKPALRNRIRQYIKLTAPMLEHIQHSLNGQFLTIEGQNGNPEQIFNNRLMPAVVMALSLDPNRQSKAAANSAVPRQLQARLWWLSNVDEIIHAALAIAADIIRYVGHGISVVAGAVSNQQAAPFQRITKDWQMAFASADGGAQFVTPWMARNPNAFWTRFITSGAAIVWSVAMVAAHLIALARFDQVLHSPNPHTLAASLAAFSIGLVAQVATAFNVISAAEYGAYLARGGNPVDYVSQGNRLPDLRWAVEAIHRWHAKLSAFGGLSPQTIVRFAQAA
ncbi:MAG TPA: nucleoside monophosphate kinase [Elusimicrobiota bacterium]|nr:nucleoside monophosphate kinase [Elusimicrobiota bacterium]